MKRLMIMAFFVMGITLSIDAQRHRKPPSIDERVERATEKLNLTEDQAEEWRSVHIKYDEELKSAMADRDREKARQTMQTMDVELTAILDDAQKAKFEEMKNERRQRRKRGKE